MPNYEEVTVKQNNPVTYNGSTVITTEMLASVYETDVRNISNNFNNNIDKFQKGKHYILLQGDELKRFKGIHTEYESLKYASKLYLWTERGANRHCKILDTDKAWEQFDYLEESYFKVKNSDVHQLMESFKNEIRVEVAEMVRQSKENHRLSHKTKLNLNNIIKNYAICDGDVEVLKQMTLDHFGASKWQDISYDRKSDVIKYIRCTAKDLGMFVQESFLY